MVHPRLEQYQIDQTVIAVSVPEALKLFYGRTICVQTKEPEVVRLVVRNQHYKRTKIMEQCDLYHPKALFCQPLWCL